MSFVLPLVKTALRPFISSDQVEEIMSLSIASGLPMVLFGPAGHGKSDMIRAVFNSFEGTQYIKAFGSGSTQEDLYGGIDVSCLKPSSEEKTIRYNLENSFLAADMAAMEEMLDAPARTLTFLKDTLSSGQYNDGINDPFPMKTKLLWVPTNKTPNEVAKDPSIQALVVERFPLALMVNLPDYESERYEDLFARQDLVSSLPTPKKVDFNEYISDLRKKVAAVTVPSTVKSLISNLFSVSHKRGVTISPRMAKYAFLVVKAAATIQNRSIAKTEDVRALKYLQNMEIALRDFEEELRRTEIEENTGKEIKAHELKVAALITAFNAIGRLDASARPAEYLKIHKQSMSLRSEVDALSYTDKLSARKSNMIDNLGNLSKSALTKALENVQP